MSERVRVENGEENIYGIKNCRGKQGKRTGERNERSEHVGGF